MMCLIDTDASQLRDRASMIEANAKALRDLQCDAPPATRKVRAVSSGCDLAYELLSSSSLQVLIYPGAHADPAKEPCDRALTDIDGFGIKVLAGLFAHRQPCLHLRHCFLS